MSWRILQPPTKTLVHALATTRYGNTTDAYVDKSNIALSLPGGRVLAHWDNPHANVRVPRLSALTSSMGDAWAATVTRSVDAFVEKLFEVSKVSKMLPFFAAAVPPAKEGSLHVMLKICAASLIMYHNEVLSTYKIVNPVASKLVEVAKSVRITDPRHPNAQPEIVLGYWSDYILSDWKQRNPEIQPATADMVSMAKTVNGNSEKIESMDSKIDVLISQIKESNTRASYYEEQANGLARENSALRDENLLLRQQLSAMKSIMKTPPAACKSSSNDITTHYNNAANSDPPIAFNLSPAMVSHVTTSKANKPPAQSKKANSTPKTIGYNARSNEADEKLGKGVSISMLIIDMFKDRLLAAHHWRAIKIPARYEEKQSARNTLELSQFVATEEEVNSLKNNDLSDHELSSLATAIEERAFLKLWELEGKDPTLEEQKNKSRSGNQRKQPLYLAVGARVRKYKQEVLQGDKDTVLIERPAAVAQAPAAAEVGKDDVTGKGKVDEGQQRLTSMTYKRAPTLAQKNPDTIVLKPKSRKTKEKKSKDQSLSECLLGQQKKKQKHN